MTDLFETPEIWPKRLDDTIQKYLTKSEIDLSDLADMKKECEAIGYTFEYGLDGIPFNIKKID